MEEIQGVMSILITNRVGLHKATKIGVIDASRVVIEFQHWDQNLASIAVTSQIVAT